MIPALHISCTAHWTLVNGISSSVQLDTELRANDFTLRWQSETEDSSDWTIFLCKIQSSVSKYTWVCL